MVPAQRTGVTFDGRYYAVNNHSLAIEMALNGLGVVMGRKTLIQPLLDAGRLVALSENEAPSPFGYDLICPGEPLTPALSRL